jgi:competence protein ComEC
VLANGLAIPVVRFIVMPAALVAVSAMPFGLERWPLELMGFGLNRVLAISDWVAGLPGSTLVLPQIAAPGALLMAAAAAVLCLAARRHKPWSVALLLAGLLAARLTPFPDLLVEHTAANVALRNAAGELVFAQPRKGSFAAGRWLQSNGEQASLAVAAGREGWSCRAGICRAELKGRRIAYATDENAVLPECAAFDILISAAPLRGRCRNVSLRIDRFDVWKRGAHAVRLDDGKLSLSTSAGLAGQRPWVVVPTARARRKE